MYVSPAKKKKIEGSTHERRLKTSYFSGKLNLTGGGGIVSRRDLKFRQHGNPIYNA